MIFFLLLGAVICFKTCCAQMAAMYRMREMRLAKVMAQGRHLTMMLDPMQQCTQQLRAQLAAESLSPGMALQQAHAAKVIARRLLYGTKHAINDESSPPELCVSVSWLLMSHA